MSSTATPDEASTSSGAPATGLDVKSIDPVTHLGIDSPFLPLGAPYVLLPPHEGSPEAYNEDEIASLFNEIFQIFLDLKYLMPDEVAFPPANTGRHRLENAFLMGPIGMNRRVVSLLQRLPFIIKKVPDDHVQFFASSIGINYTNESEEFLFACRDPPTYHRFAVGRWYPNPSYLRPDDLPLCYGYQSDGPTWVLDTEANSMRIFHGYVVPPRPGNTIDNIRAYNHMRPDAETHYNYRNYYGVHAPTVLKDYIHKLRTLAHFPIDNKIVLPHMNPVHRAMAQKLKEEYGWPDNFRKEDWHRDLEKVRAEAKEEAKLGTFEQLNCAQCAAKSYSSPGATSSDSRCTSCYYHIAWDYNQGEQDPIADIQRAALSQAIADSA